MPDSIRVAVFTFGAILLLIGLLGGGFKLFGAEVSGNAGRGIRWLAAIFGLSLVIFGLHDQLPDVLPSPPSEPTNQQDKPTSVTASEQPIQAPQPAPEPAPQPAPEPETKAPEDDRVAVAAPKVPCRSSPDKPAGDARIRSASFVGYRGDVNIAEVDFSYDKSAFPKPVYIRATAYQRNNKIAEGFAHALKSDGVASMLVEAIVADKMESDWIEVSLCSEGRLISNRQFKTRGVWQP